MLTEKELLRYSPAEFLDAVGAPHPTVNFIDYRAISPPNGGEHPFPRTTDKRIDRALFDGRDYLELRLVSGQACVHVATTNDAPDAPAVARRLIKEFEDLHALVKWTRMIGAMYT